MRQHADKDAAQNKTLARLWPFWATDVVESNVIVRGIRGRSGGSESFPNVDSGHGCRADFLT
ncbi:MAG: hypothetical protein KGL52_17605, partial [Rhodospirillales bacterium]|nr:hypothetical protein [Rhodospirillales bacterium]